MNLLHRTGSVYDVAISDIWKIYIKLSLKKNDEQCNAPEEIPTKEIVSQKPYLKDLIFP